MALIAPPVSSGVVRRVRTNAALTPDAAGVCAPFGVIVDRAGPPTLHADRLIELAGSVTIVTGPSGCGKTTLLRVIERRLLERGERVVPACDPPAGTRPVVDLPAGDPARRAAALARAGLGEAMILPRSPAELSEGEQARLRLALALDRAEQLGPGSWVLCDELGSVLDRATAQAVGRSASKWARAVGVRLVGASAHEDLPRLIGADQVMAPDASGVFVARGPARATPPRLRIENGTIADYDALARFHYRAGRPATCAIVRRAMRTLPGGGERLAGVLVVSRPTLNASWRRHAWPGRYEGDKRSAARRINRELRCLSRVVVEPSSRGLGVARRLVEDYLARPLTPATEAVAQMGALCPFFERAGMRAYPLAPSPDDARLLDCLDAFGGPLGGVVSPESAERAAACPLARRELARWARARKVARAIEPLAMPVRVRAAAALASAAPVAYAHSGARP